MDGGVHTNRSCCRRPKTDRLVIFQSAPTRLRYQFEAISRMPMEEQELVRGLLDAVIVKHQVAGAIARAAGPAAKGKES